MIITSRYIKRLIILNKLQNEISDYVYNVAEHKNCFCDLCLIEKSKTHLNSCKCNTCFEVRHIKRDKASFFNLIEKNK